MSLSVVVGIGSALVDMLLLESDYYVSCLGAAKGGMTLVGDAYIEKCLKLSKRTPTIVPGGSACNTIAGIGMLGGRARFIGKCGNDELGRLFRRELERSGVETILSTSATPTGRVLSVVTPDAQRTMFTFLGAAAEASPQDIDKRHLSDATIVHIEGYLLFNHDLIIAALERAKECGARISLDLASFTIVKAHRDFLRQIIPRFVDILIANEDEAREFTGFADEEAALLELATIAPIAVVKIGKRGSLIAQNRTVSRVGIVGNGEAIDTTGAGDLWAAGFLYGLASGYSIEQCGRIAAACGYEVCQVLGAQIPPAGWERIRKKLPPANSLTKPGGL